MYKIAASVKLHFASCFFTKRTAATSSYSSTNKNLIKLVMLFFLVLVLYSEN